MMIMDTSVKLINLGMTNNNKSATLDGKENNESNQFIDNGRLDLWFSIPEIISKATFQPIEGAECPKSSDRNAGQETNANLLTRTIVLVYGLLENSNPFWVFVAVRPDKYQNFLDAQKNGSLNLYQFTPYGEIIVSGVGKSPPDEITVKVAEMYQIDPDKLREQLGE